MASCATLDLLPRFPQSYFCAVGMILKTEGIGKIGVDARVLGSKTVIDPNTYAY